MSARVPVAAFAFGCASGGGTYGADENAGPYAYNLSTGPTFATKQRGARWCLHLR